MTACTLCPRRCRAARGENGGSGFCGEGTGPRVARAAPHFWEEPCLSGARGSGTVFFSGCTLGCVYCQNRAISRGQAGKAVTPARLREIYFSLISQGVHNINLVTATQFVPAVLESLKEGLPVPVVWNSGGYETVETVDRLAPAVDIWLPDMKYALTEPARRYSRAPDYPEAAKAAICRMYDRTGPYKMGENGLLRSGVMIRHLVLPGNIDNTFAVLDWISETFPRHGVLVSLMSQFTPTPDCAPFPELTRGLTEEEHRSAIDYMARVGITDGFTQDRGSAAESFIPAFDLTGV